MISTKRAKKILPKSEFEQFEAVIENQISRMSRSRLMQKASIARRLRDKYKGEARRQGAAAKKRMTNETDVSQNMARAEIFDQLMIRIDQELNREARTERPKRPQRSAATATEADQDIRQALLDAKRRIPNSLGRESYPY